MTLPDTPPNDALRLALPKGRMQSGVLRLLADAGIGVSLTDREYRPDISLPGFETKMLKLQNIVEMVDLGSRHVGFAGAGWVAELRADIVEVLDTGLDPVQVVAAAPSGLLVNGRLPDRRIVIASEYENLTRAWVNRMGIDAALVRSYGATEVFPPEDADCIVDNSATGSTLRANGLQVVDVLMDSTTRMYASRSAMDDARHRAAIERLVLLLGAVLEARRWVMIEVNVSTERLEAVIAALPAMREPTVSKLHGGGGYAIKAAVLRDELATVIPRIKAEGGTDVVVTSTALIVP